VDQPDAAADPGGQEDHPTLSEFAIAAFQRANEPRKLVIMPGGHFDAYVEGCEDSSSAARDFLVEHLGA
jgi:hypothetical protein